MSAKVALWDIPGGIHPPQNKQQSTRNELGQIPLPTRLILPLQQHIGARAEPVVRVGDHVLKGQLIAEANGPLSCPVHAPTSGSVSAIGPAPYPHASGLNELAIIIDSDGEDRWTKLTPITNYPALEPAVLLEIIRQAGISGLGGAGFPTAVKLVARASRQIDTLIINAAECEPYITADDMTMRNKAPQIIAGIEVLMHILKPGRVLIGIEDNKPEAITAMRAAVAERPMEVVVFPTKYPSGGERQLIQILTGQEVPSGGLPADIGMLCQNIGTMLAVYDAILLGQPMISRITTLTGDALAHPTNVQALVGTPISELLDFAGLQPERLFRLVMGGPMMGFTVLNPAAPVLKTSNCLLAGTREELPPPPPALPCIRCGLCADTCPAELLPQQLHWFALGKDYQQLQRQNLFDCIECGACSYVCPSSIPLVQYFRAGKAEIRASEFQQAKAEQSRQRFEQRQQRLQREAEQRELDRQARTEKAARMKASREAAVDTNSAPASSPVEPDLARVGAQVSSGLTAQQKQLKIASATAQMALKRAQKQLTTNPDNRDLQAQIPTLEQACAETLRAYEESLVQPTAGAAEPAKPADDNLKKAKLNMISARAALKKAERALAGAPDDVTLQAQHLDRLQALDEASRAAAEHADSKEML